MSDIFISYSSEDIVNAERLASALESHGCSVWWDRSIPVGKSYEIVIEEALDEAKCVLVIWSKFSVKSQWVRAEVAEAQRQEKLFPLNIDGSSPPLVYRALQTIDFTHWVGDINAAVFKKLLTDILNFIEKPSLYIKSQADSKIEIRASEKETIKFNPLLIINKNISNELSAKKNYENIIPKEQIKTNQEISFKKEGLIVFIVIVSLLVGVIWFDETKKKSEKYVVAVEQQELQQKINALSKKIDDFSLSIEQAVPLISGRSLEMDLLHATNEDLIDQLDEIEKEMSIYRSKADGKVSMLYVSWTLLNTKWRLARLKLSKITPNEIRYIRR